MEAIPLVAELPALLFVLLVIVLGTGLSFFIVPPLVSFIRHLPVFGDALAVWVEVAVLAQQTAIRAWMAKNTDPVLNLFDSFLSLVGGWLALFVKLLSANLAAMQATAIAAGGSAGNVGQRIIALAAQVAAQALSIGGLQTGLGNLVSQVSRALSVTVPGLIGAAVAAMASALHIGLTIEHTAMVTATAQATAVAQSLFAAAQTAIKAGDLVLGELLAHTAAALAAEIVAVQAGAKVYTDGVASQLQREIGTITDVLIPTAVGTLTLEITTIATHIDQLERECINPACQSLGAGLDLFQLLQQGVELLLIVALIGTAINNPQQTARELVAGTDELLALVNPILGAFGIQV